jgi:GH24 family phage-related lysozyme (muramidase)
MVCSIGGFDMAGALEQLMRYVGNIYNKTEKIPNQPDSANPISGLFNSNQPNYFDTLIDYEGLETQPYDDHKGIPTIGIGHRIMPGEDFTGYTKQDFEKLFVEQDLPKYINRTKRLVNDFDNLPASLQEEMVSSVFRGGLSGSPKTLRLINAGKYQDAAKEFLNNDEYREAKQWERENNKRHGVARRMENLAKELNSLNRR